MKFTIETTYDLPIYRQRTYEADTPEEAFAAALADDDWEKSEKDYDTSGPTRITGAWEGEDAAYSGPAVPVPDTRADAAPALAAAMQGLLEAIRFTDSGHAVVEARDIKARHDAGCAALVAAGVGMDAEDIAAMLEEERSKIDRRLIQPMTTALRSAQGAIAILQEQIVQMRGMFDDADGAIQQAIDDAEAVDREITAALA